MLFITGYYTDEQVYQKIDTVQCKRVYLSAKGVSTQQVPLLGTVLLVNECIYVFCAEVFLLLVGFFWNFVHYTLYRKQSFSRPSEQQHHCAVALFFPSSSSFDFFCIFFLTSSVQYNEKMKSKASLGEHSIVRPVQLHNPHWSGPVITHHALSSPFGNSLLCFNLRKAKVGGLWTCQSSTWKWVKDRGNQSKSWEEEHEAWRQGDQCQARVDKKVGAVMHCTRSSTTQAPPPSAPLLIWGRSDWLTVNEGLNDVLNSLHNSGQQVVELQYLLVSVEVFCWSLSTVREAMAVKVSASSFSRLWASSRDWPTVGAILCRDVQCLPTDHEKINYDKDRYVIKTSTPELL